MGPAAGSPWLSTGPRQDFQDTCRKGCHKTRGSFGFLLSGHVTPHGALNFSRPQCPRTVVSSISDLLGPF